MLQPNTLKTNKARIKKRAGSIPPVYVHYIFDHYFFDHYDYDH